MYPQYNQFFLISSGIEISGPITYIPKKIWNDKGKPGENRGRKAMGLKVYPHQ
jgi:hypothetical protein